MRTFGRAARVAPTGLAAAVAMTLSGCAGFTFYSDPDLQRKTGIPVYAPKPYLLVVTGQKEKPVDATVVYMNDPKPLIYAEPRSGWGSADLSLALSNGVLTAFGQKTDPQVKELITSLGGLLTAGATAAKTMAEADQIRRGQEQSGGLSDSEINEVLAVRDDIAAKLKDGSLNELGPEERKKISDVGQVLSGFPASNTSTARTVIAAQAAVLEQVAASARAQARKPVATVLTGWAQRLRAVAGAIAEAGQTAVFELYEIVQTPAGNTLRRVSPP